MKHTLNQYIAIISLLISPFASPSVMAAECGQAKLVEAGSAGVTVSKSTCPEPSRVALGSTLELTSGSRMWLKFDPNATGESIQLICQNKSASTVSVNIASAATPWVNPQGVKQCNPWDKNKLSCEGANGEKNGFFCAAATAKATKVGTALEKKTSVAMKEVKPEITTSVKMRGVLPLPAATTVAVEDIIKNIKPEIELCKSLYDVSDKLEMSWTVSLGKIKDLVVKSEDKDLVSCVEAVVNQANAKQDTSVKYSF